MRRVCACTPVHYEQTDSAYLSNRYLDAVEPRVGVLFRGAGGVAREEVVGSRTLAAGSLMNNDWTDNERTMEN
jgi:hypothetical protein